MRIYLNELSEEPKHLEYTEKDKWVMETIRGAQESELEKEKPILVEFDLRKSQDVVFLHGKLDLDIGLICSRCANNFDHHIAGQYDSMFSRNPSLTSTGGKPGTAHSEPTNGSAQDPEMELLEKDFFELSDVLKEQIYLQIPVKPLCKDQCKGICDICGQDQNVQPCQCHRLKKTAMASALKKAKIRIS